MEAILSAVGEFASLGAEYAAADAQRRQHILDEADACYRTYREQLAGLPAALKANDAAADAVVAALPGAAPVARAHHMSADGTACMNCGLASRFTVGTLCAAVPA